MRVHVRLFGRYRELASESSVALDLPAGADVGDLVRALHEWSPEPLPSLPVVAVNRATAQDDQALAAHDEIALSPPGAGG
jgi:molybdopterin converting factor small subunit